MYYQNTMTNYEVYKSGAIRNAVIKANYCLKTIGKSEPVIKKFIITALAAGGM